MSYEQMEAMLVQGIAEMRTTEAVILRSMKSGSDSVSTEYARLQEQVKRVEGLLAAMDVDSFHMPAPASNQQAFAAHRS
ncbi:MAG TPA: hypothetical protein VEX68_14230 [Bryobacteraceae bacterium]|nr:hypothetical protein [Bryobacteraceae bacterium]